MTTPHDFIQWLKLELEKRSWRQIDLAKRAYIDQGLLSRILNGITNAGPDTCISIARALKIPPEQIFRRAALLPKLLAPENDIILEEIYEFAKRLTLDERRQVRDYTKYGIDIYLSFPAICQLPGSRFTSVRS